MIKVLGGAALVVVAGLGGGALWMHGIEAPSYETRHFADKYLELDYPAAWGAPGFREEVVKKGAFRGWFYSTRDESFGTRAPFNTRWDKAQATFMINDYPADRFGDPKKYLIDEYQRQRGDYSGKEPVPSPLREVRIGGLSGWRVTTAAHEDVLDIGPFKHGLYERFFQGRPSADKILLPAGNGRTFEISYQVPSDKLARARYEAVYNRLIASLKFK